MKGKKANPAIQGRFSGGIPVWGGEVGNREQATGYREPGGSKTASWRGFLSGGGKEGIGNRQQGTESRGAARQRVGGSAGSGWEGRGAMEWELRVTAQRDLDREQI